MNIIFLGVPSCGKGTQAEFVSKKRKIVHLSIGELLRKKTEDPLDPLGISIKEKINKGLLVDDDLIMDIIEEFLKELSSDEGILFDGFPRSVEQAKLLDRLFIKCGREIDYVINFELDDRVDYLHKKKIIINPPTVNGGVEKIIANLDFEEGGE